MDDDREARGMTTIDVLAATFFALVTPMVVVGFLELVYYPLALSFERRKSKGPDPGSAEPLVSIVVPAYNEGRVIRNCIESLLSDGYPHKEVFLVDDGSTDDTLVVMREYEQHSSVTVVSQANAGKAAALNTGIARASGEILFFVDADGIFTPSTVREMLTGFDSPRVGAVCGNDEPVNLDRPQTHLLALLTHGTAFVRRALARINCLSIVSGNCGAFRRSVVTEVGGFTEGFIGEDLELTWRVHRAGYRVNFRPRAMVYAEVPSTLRALWKQRVRWTRGLIQTARLHKDMLFTSRHGRVGWYLPFNLMSTLAFPIVQLLSLTLIVTLVASGNSPVSPAVASTLGWVGLATASAAVCFALALDRAWGDLRFLYVIPTWAFFSLMLSLVTITALILEAKGAPNRWNKLTRTGVVSRAS
jgi:biofilm PGA synthesis N-glycosyltransferase PgaC